MVRINTLVISDIFILLIYYSMSNVLGIFSVNILSIIPNIYFIKYGDIIYIISYS